VVDLAKRLRDLSLVQSAAGLHKSALETAREARKLYVGLAAKYPIAFADRLRVEVRVLFLAPTEFGSRRSVSPS
jgi:hypothetical protein